MWQIKRLWRHGSGYNGRQEVFLVKISTPVSFICMVVVFAAEEYLTSTKELGGYKGYPGIYQENSKASQAGKNDLVIFMP